MEDHRVQRAPCVSYRDDWPRRGARQSRRGEVRILIRVIKFKTIDIAKVRGLSPVEGELIRSYDSHQVRTRMQAARRGKMKTSVDSATDIGDDKFLRAATRAPFVLHAEAKRYIAGKYPILSSYERHIRSIYLRESLSSRSENLGDSPIDTFALVPVESLDIISPT